MPTNSEFSRIDIGPRNPHFEGTESQQGGQVPDTYQHVTNADNSDASASLSSSTFRGNEYRPENLLDSQASQVEQMVNAKRESEELYGLRTPVAGPGVHPFLRDTVAGYGNQPPDGEKGIPTFRDK